MPAAERLVWKVVRNRGLGGFKFRRQVAVGPYIADFLCPAARLILEIDGDSHNFTIHQDTLRDRYLAARGYRVERISNADVFENLEGAMQVVLAALRAANPSP